MSCRDSLRPIPSGRSLLTRRSCFSTEIRNPALVIKNYSNFEYDDGLDKYDPKYDAYEEEVSPMRDRKARKHRKPKQVPLNIEQKSHLVEKVVDPATLGGVKMTYVPSKHEAGWLTDSLKGFFEEHYITDVLAAVKGGKEAS